jgi:hypothetical protein
LIYYWISERLKGEGQDELFCKETDRTSFSC